LTTGSPQRTYAPQQIAPAPAPTRTEHSLLDSLQNWFGMNSSLDVSVAVEVLKSICGKSFGAELERMVTLDLELACKIARVLGGDKPPISHVINEDDSVRFNPPTRKVQLKDLLATARTLQSVAPLIAAELLAAGAAFEGEEPPMPNKIELLSRCAQILRENKSVRLCAGTMNMLQPHIAHALRCREDGVAAGKVEWWPLIIVSSDPQPQPSMQDVEGTLQRRNVGDIGASAEHSLFDSLEDWLGATSQRQVPMALNVLKEIFGSEKIEVQHKLILERDPELARQIVNVLGGHQPPMPHLLDTDSQRLRFESPTQALPLKDLLAIGRLLAFVAPEVGAEFLAAAASGEGQSSNDKIELWDACADILRLRHLQLCPATTLLLQSHLHEALQYEVDGDVARIKWAPLILASLEMLLPKLDHAIQSRDADAIGEILNQLRDLHHPLADEAVEKALKLVKTMQAEDQAMQALEDLDASAQALAQLGFEVELDALAGSPLELVATGFVPARHARALAEHAIKLLAIPGYERRTFFAIVKFLRRNAAKVDHHAAALRKYRGQALRNCLIHGDPHVPAFLHDFREHVVLFLCSNLKVIVPALKAKGAQAELLGLQAWCETSLVEIAKDIDDKSAQGILNSLKEALAIMMPQGSAPVPSSQRMQQKLVNPILRECAIICGDGFEEASNPQMLEPLVQLIALLGGSPYTFNAFNLHVALAAAKKLSPAKRKSHLLAALEVMRSGEKLLLEGWSEDRIVALTSPDGSLLARLCSTAVAIDQIQASALCTGALCDALSLLHEGEKKVAQDPAPVVSLRTPDAIAVGRMRSFMMLGIALGQDGNAVEVAEAILAMQELDASMRLPVVQHVVAACLRQLALQGKDEALIRLVGAVAPATQGPPIFVVDQAAAGDTKVLGALFNALLACDPTPANQRRFAPFAAEVLSSMALKSGSLAQFAKHLDLVARYSPSFAFSTLCLASAYLLQLGAPAIAKSAVEMLSDSTFRALSALQRAVGLELASGSLSLNATTNNCFEFLRFVEAMEAELGIDNGELLTEAHIKNCWKLRRTRM
jgi:hypothetical protein